MPLPGGRHAEPQASGRMHVPGGEATVARGAGRQGQPVISRLVFR